MIKKIRRGEIIKSLHLDESFVDNNDFYVPINIDSNNAKMLDAKFLLLSFIPEFILGRESPVIGLSTRIKPLFIKNLTKNKKIFEIEDVEDESTNNPLFKKIYSSNIVSSYNNKDYIDNLTDIGFVFNEQESNVKVITKSKVSDIQNSTLAIYGQFQKFYLNVYALNSNLEMLDFVSELSSGPIDSFSVAGFNDNINMMQNALNNFGDFFNFLFLPYRFPVRERILNSLPIRGVNYRIDSQDNSILDTDLLSKVNVYLQSEELNKSYKIKSFEQNNLVNNDSFSFDLIRSNRFFNFINECYQYYRPNLRSEDQINFKLFFEGIHSNNSISIKKDYLVYFSTLEKTYEDLLRFRMENNIERGSVASLSLTKINNSENNDNSRIKRYSITLSLNSLSFNTELFNSRFNVEFFDIDGIKVNNIKELFFDDSLTEGNSISLSNSILLNNIIPNSDNITLYFDTLRNIKECYLLFYYNGEPEFTRIGPFIAQESIYSFNRVARNIFDEASLAISRGISRTAFDTNDVREFISGNRSKFDTLSITTNNLIENINFKNLNYFIANSSLEPANLENQLSNVLQNVLIRVNKKIVVSNIEIASINHYCILSDIVNDSTTNTIETNTFVSPIIINNTDYRSALSNRLDVFNSLNSFLSMQNYNLIDENFKADVYVAFSFIVMKNNTVLKFGNSVDGETRESKVNLVDFIIENNSNFSSLELNNLVNIIFSDQYFEQKSSVIEKIFNLSNKNSVDFLLSKKIDKDDILRLDADDSFEANEVLFNSVRFSDYQKESNLQLRNNLISDFTRRNLTNSSDISFLVTKKMPNKPSIVFFGDKVFDIIEQKNLNNINFITAKMTANYQIDKSTNIDVSNIDGLNTYRSSDCIYVSVKNPDVVDLSLEIKQNTIEADVVQNEFLFSHINKEFYQILSSCIQSETNIKKLIIKNIILRVCLEFDYEDRIISLSKNIVLKPSENFNNYLREHSLSLENNRINIDLLDESKDYFMPVMSYRRQPEIRSRIGRI